MPRNSTVYADRHQRQRHRHFPELPQPEPLEARRAGLAANDARLTAASAELLLLDRWASRASIAGARARIDAVLALACVEHDASPGQPCWGGHASGVKGFCSARFARVIATDAERIHGGKGDAR
jgi:hypothetical protein